MTADIQEGARVVSTDRAQLVSDEIAVLSAPETEAARRFLNIASQLQHANVELGIRSFCFIGDQSGVGVSVTAANVAAAFMQSGMRTLLIEAHLETPKLGQMFGLDSQHRGLSNWLVRESNHEPLSHFFQMILPGLALISAGTRTLDAAPLMSTQLRPLVLDMSRMFDVVILDCAPITNLASALAAATAAERCIVVARTNVTRQRQLTDIETRVRQAGGEIGGAVLLAF